MGIISTGYSCFLNYFFQTFKTRALLKVAHEEVIEGITSKCYRCLLEKNITNNEVVNTSHRKCTLMSCHITLY